MIMVEMHFAQNKITASLADSLSSSFCQILRSFGNNLDESIGNIVTVSSSDVATLWKWNETLPEYLPECVHKRVEKQAREKPDFQAICSYDRDFTYRELDQTAQKLANYLVSLGVGPEVLVPLCFSKSSWAIVSMLAVLKAGGACVSVSPAYPAARMGLILDDTEAIIVLCSPEHQNLFAIRPVASLAIDEGFMDSCPSVEPDLRTLPTDTDPAFVVYTSGSTGKPKGVVVEHGAMCTSARDHGAAFGIGHGSRAIQFANYTFDASIQDIFTSLQRGGTVCVLSEEERLNGLAQAINDRRANYAELTPTVAALLNPADVPGLRYMSVGGESLNQQVVDMWGPALRLLNTWGPSEASIDASCSEPLAKGSRPSNIGKAVGCRLWIVNPQDHDALSPIGVTGEMLIEGHILARGYLNDIEKTDAVFIENPRFMEGRVNGLCRMYKTGDLAYYAPDGSIEFVGRKAGRDWVIMTKYLCWQDNQVKLNGQRFELGEVEHHLEAQATDARGSAPTSSRPMQTSLCERSWLPTSFCRSLSLLEFRYCP
ncbi:hypothetical protein MRB53_037830 [Persea americana]|nr:hypothetical protein MRB53_037830 [Persea americana]